MTNRRGFGLCGISVRRKVLHNLNIWDAYLAHHSPDHGFDSNCPDHSWNFSLTANVNGWGFLTESGTLTLLLQALANPNQSTGRAGQAGSTIPSRETNMHSSSPRHGHPHIIIPRSLAFSLLSGGKLKEEMAQNASMYRSRVWTNEVLISSMNNERTKESRASTQVPERERIVIARRSSSQQRAGIFTASPMIKFRGRRQSNTGTYTCSATPPASTVHNRT
ncbi:hypothetical protein C8R44DRAFT_733146 [Mycena epipterygia]|nr:hypothetical protein C8R44DRAFT_733146 [Mycena epipterygia]